MGTVRGVSGIVLLPAREYEWELKARGTIRIPRRGSIEEVLGDRSLAEDLKIGGEDEFSIFDDNILLLWELVRVLFADVKYPALEDDECFNIMAIEIADEEILVHGEVIRMV